MPDTQPGTENTVYVGRKGTMVYVLAIVTQMNQGATTVNIKARGKAISRAVDVAEIVRNKFLKDIKIKNIGISTEELMIEEETSRSSTPQPLKISAIEITLVK